MIPNLIETIDLTPTRAESRVALETAFPCDADLFDALLAHAEQVIADSDGYTQQDRAVAQTLEASEMLNAFLNEEL